MTTSHVEAIRQEVARMSEHRAAALRHETLAREFEKLRRQHALSSADFERARAEYEESRLARHEADENRAGARAAHDRFRDEVRSYVAEFKMRRTPPERMLVAVRHAVTLAAEAAHPPIDARELSSEAVQWAIDVYYPAA